MKNKIFPTLPAFIIAAVLSSALLTGCGPEEQQDATVGAVGGGVIGGVLGNNMGHHAAGGALIGAALGGLAGGAYGDAQDQKRAQQVAYERQLAAEQAENQRIQAESERARLMSYGYSVDAPEVLAARQRAEALESQVAELRKEQAQAEQREREIEAYRAREAAAQQELQQLKSQNPPPPPPGY